MWEAVTPAKPGQKNGSGVDVATIVFGKHKTPIVRIRIWEDVLEDLAFRPESDVSLALGRGAHDGQLKIELDRLGAYTLKAPRGTTRYLQLQAVLKGWEHPVPARGVSYEIIADGDGLIVLTGEPAEAAGKAPPVPSPPQASPAPSPPQPVRKTQAGVNPRQAEDRVLPPPPPAPPPKPADRGGPDWLQPCLAEAKTDKVRDVLRLLGSGRAVTLSAVIYAFSPPMKEAIADSLISEVRRTVERAGWRLIRRVDGSYRVGSKRDED